MSSEDSLLNAINVISDSFGENFDADNFREMVQLTKAYYKDRRQFRALLNSSNDENGRPHLVNTVRNGNVTWAKKVIQLLDEIDNFTIESQQFLGKECYICYEPFEQNQIVYKVPCRGQHIFHKDCIDKWVNINSSCPYCRDLISIENITGFLNKSSHSGKSVLYYAIKLGNLPFVEQLLEKGAMVNYQNASPLHIAAGFNHKDLVTHFLAKGEDINTKDLFNQTPIYYACRYAGPEIIQYLLENGAEIHLSYCESNDPDTDEAYDTSQNIEETILHVLATKNTRYSESIQLVIEYFKSKNLSIDLPNSLNKTPLELAIQGNNFFGVKQLVDAGANLKNLDNKHPLFLALKYQHPKLDQEDEHLDSDEEEELFPVPLPRRVDWKERDIFRFLLKSLEEQTSKDEFIGFVSRLFRDACLQKRTNHWKIILKEYTFPIDSSCFPTLASIDFHHTLLKYNILEKLIDIPEFFLTAIKENNIRLVNYYIQSGKDINIADQNGNRAGHFVQSDMMLGILAENNFDFTKVNAKGETPLHTHMGTYSCPHFFLTYKYEMKRLEEEENTRENESINIVVERNVAETPVARTPSTVETPPIPVPRRITVKKVVARKRIESSPSQDMISVFLKKGVNINAKTNEGLTALQIVAHTDHARIDDIIQFLVDHGADVNEKSNYKSPLHIAMLSSNLHAIYTLIRNQADINCLYDDETILHYAVHTKNIHLIKVLLEIGMDVNMKNKRGETALLFSLIKSKDLNDISKYLLEKGGKLDDSTSKYIDLCLRKAVGNCNLNLIKHLVELGADIHKENKSKQTPIFFVGHGSDRLEVLKYLIGQGANINHQDKEGTTLLQEAALDEPEFVQFLIDNGADVNVKNNMGCTPLLNAVGNVPSSERCADRNLEEIVERQMNIVKCLVEHGANVNDRDITGQTPIFGSPNIHITKYLIEKGADVNAVDLSGQTLLFDKISTINAIGFREFMEIGININIQDCRGYTVLHEAVEKRTANLLGGVCFTDFMISHGADPYLRTNSGLTAIELADSLGRNTLFQGHFRNNASQSEQDTIQPQVNPPPVIDSDEEIEEQEIEIDSDAYFTDDEMDIFLQENNTRLEQLSMQGIRFRIGRRRGRLVIILQE